MVVFVASFIGKSGKELASMYYVDDPQIERSVAAFPKLVGTGVDQGYVETEDLRYVFKRLRSMNVLLITKKQGIKPEELKILQRECSFYGENELYRFDYKTMSSLYLLLVTDKEWDPWGDLELLHILAKTVHESYLRSEEEIYKTAAIDLSCFDKVIEHHSKHRHLKHMPSRITPLKIHIDYGDRGDRGGTIETGGLLLDSGLDLPNYEASANSPGVLEQIMKINKFLESFMGEGEGELIGHPLLENLMVEGEVIDHIASTVEETLDVKLKLEGGIERFTLFGSFSVNIHNQDDGLIHFEIESGENQGNVPKIHPSINEELFFSKNILGFKNPDRPFPADRINLLKWRMQITDESLLPLTINCLRSIHNGVTSVRLKCEASPKFDPQDVVISIPVPACRFEPLVLKIDGWCQFNSSMSTLEWSVSIDRSNLSGSMGFVIPAVITPDYFPISASFTCTTTFCDYKVAKIIPLGGRSAPKFAQTTRRLSTRVYQVV